MAPWIYLNGYLRLEESCGIETKLGLEDFQWSLADVGCPLGAGLHREAVHTQYGFFGSHGDVGHQCKTITGGGSGLTSTPGKVDSLLPSTLPVVIGSSAQLVSGCPELRLVGCNDWQPFVDDIEFRWIANAQKSGVKGSTMAIRLVEVLPTTIHQETLIRHLGKVGGTKGNGFLAGHQINLAKSQADQCDAN